MPGPYIPLYHGKDKYILIFLLFSINRVFIITIFFSNIIVFFNWLIRFALCAMNECSSYLNCQLYQPVESQWELWTLCYKESWTDIWPCSGKYGSSCLNVLHCCPLWLHPNVWCQSASEWKCDLRTHAPSLAHPNKKRQAETVHTWFWSWTWSWFK